VSKTEYDRAKDIILKIAVSEGMDIEGLDKAMELGLCKSLLFTYHFGAVLIFLFFIRQCSERGGIFCRRMFETIQIRQAVSVGNRSLSFLF